MTQLTVIAPGWATTVQDRGRPGYAHLGVSPSGTVDTALAARLNGAVGNPANAAVIETVGGLVLRADTATMLITSTEPVVRALAPGADITVPADPDRTWVYVAVRGGVAVSAVLGSRSTDTLSGIGPPPLAAGMVLPIGRDPGTEFATEPVPIGPLRDVARVSVGPRIDWFVDDALDRLAGATLTVGAVDRIGVRLLGAPALRCRDDELPSEGLVRGAIQVPPSGELVMMLADHPTTGGYPVIAVVHPDDVATIAHHRPGTTVTLRPTR